MEYINKIELQGKVGHVRYNEFRDQHVQNFSLSTEYISQNSNGAIFCETTWHQVTACDKEQVKQGDSVNVKGRIRQTRYTTADGAEKFFSEVIANEITIIE